MAEPLEAELELDADAALRAIDQLEESLTSALDVFAEQFLGTLDEVSSTPVLVDVSADASGVTDSLDEAVDSADAEVVVDADASDVGASIDDEIASVDAEVVVEGSVELDTSDAEASLASLSDGLGDVGGAGGDGAAGLADFAGGADVAGSASGLATGNAAALGGALGSLGPKGAVAGAAITGVVGGIGALFVEAVAAQGAVDAFNLSLGESAPAVEALDLLDLNMGLGDLAQRLGSSDDAIRAATTTFFRAATASGQTREQVEFATQAMIGLAAQAVAVDPSIGSIESAMKGLERALGRGGARLAQYGISLSTAEIQQRAMTDTGKESTAELSHIELAMSGASLAMEKYGIDLERIEAGMENPIIQLRFINALFGDTIKVLAEPLVPGILVFLEDLIPVAEVSGRLLVAIGQVALPGVQAGFDLLVPLLELSVVGMEALNTVLVPVAAGLEKAGDGASLFGGALRSGIIGSIPIVGPALGLGANLLDAFSDSSDDAAGSTTGFALRLPGLADALADVSGEAADVEFRTMLRDVPELSRALSDADMSASDFARQVRDAAAAILDGETTVESATDAFSEQEGVTDSLAEMFGLLATETADSMGAMEAWSDVAGGDAIAAAEAQEEALARLEEAYASYHERVLATFPVGQEAITNALGALDEFSLDGFLEELDKLADAAFGFVDNLQQLPPDIAAALAPLGPLVGGPLAASLVEAGDEGIAGLRDRMERLNVAEFVADGFAVENNEELLATAERLGIDVADMYDRGLVLDAPTALELEAVTGAVASARDVLPSFFGGLGADGASQYADGLGGMDSSTSEVLGGLLGAVDDHRPSWQSQLGLFGADGTLSFAGAFTPEGVAESKTSGATSALRAALPGFSGVASTLGLGGTSAFGGGFNLSSSSDDALQGAARTVESFVRLPSVAHFLGLATGRALVAGAVEGVASSSWLLDAAARTMISSAKTAADAEAQNTSPSKLFMQVGEDIVEGLMLPLDVNADRLRSTMADLIGTPSVTAGGAGSVHNHVEVAITGVERPEQVATAVRDVLRDELGPPPASGAFLAHAGRR